MKDCIMRLESICLKNFKNISYGKFDFEEYKQVKQGVFNDFKSVLGVYGQNGSGKTSIVDAMSIFSKVISGVDLNKDTINFIEKGKTSFSIKLDYYIEYATEKILANYGFEIKNVENDAVITNEYLHTKTYNAELEKWNKKRVLIEYKNNEILPRKFINEISKDKAMELKIAKELQKNKSFIYNYKNYKCLVDICEENKDKDFLRIVKAFNSLNYAKLIIIDNKSLGNINMNYMFPLRINLDRNRGFTIPINLMRASSVSVEEYDLVTKGIEQISLVLRAMIPSLNLEAVELGKQLNGEGKEEINFEIVANRNHKKIPLRYESEGIKRLISILNALIAVYNDKSVCLIIDELDSGIFEYLLGELLQIFDESAKGQLIFTSHNLRALEKLSVKSIVFTTMNPENRFIYLSNVKSNNNLRDFYLREIQLGGQKECVYNETNSYDIKHAFKKAGMSFAYEK